MARVSKPMKLIALRIDEEEKARLEQMAEERDVTLSRALREGAALYLSELRQKAHQARGGDATFHGVRRDEAGRRLNRPSKPSAGEVERVRRLREALLVRGLGSIRAAWDRGAAPAVVAGALAQWLSLVGRVYVSNEGFVGWTWFVRDYCPGYRSREAAVALCNTIRGGLVAESTLEVEAALDAVSIGFLRLLEDAETQELVRRAVLPSWDVLERELAA